MTDAASSGPNIGDRIEMTAMNGHRLLYTVTGFYDDGFPQTSQHDAEHSGNCPCWTSKEHEPLPDW